MVITISSNEKDETVFAPKVQSYFALLMPYRTNPNPMETVQNRIITNLVSFREISQSSGEETILGIL